MSGQYYINIYQLKSVKTYDRKADNRARTRMSLKTDIGPFKLSALWYINPFPYNDFRTFKNYILVKIAAPVYDFQFLNSCIKLFEFLFRLEKYFPQKNKM